MYEQDDIIDVTQLTDEITAVTFSDGIMYFSDQPNLRYQGVK